MNGQPPEASWGAANRTRVIPGAPGPTRANDGPLVHPASASLGDALQIEGHIFSPFVEKGNRHRERHRPELNIGVNDDQTLYQWRGSDVDKCQQEPLDRKVRHLRPLLCDRVRSTSAMDLRGWRISGR